MAAKLCSDPNFFFDEDTVLLSPPHNWPACFKDGPLRRFLGKRGLKSLRCRLVLRDQVPSELTAHIATVTLHPNDSWSNARLLKQWFGWEILSGYSVFEVCFTCGKTLELRCHAAV